MSTEPVVVERRSEGSAAEVDLLVPNDLVYFAGHFPGMPIVPGVVQIGWAVAFARQCLGVQEEIVGMEALKFHNVMRPGERVTLALELKRGAARAKVRFSFQSPQTRYSSGRLLLRAVP